MWLGSMMGIRPSPCEAYGESGLERGVGCQSGKRVEFVRTRKKREPIADELYRGRSRVSR